MGLLVAFGAAVAVLAFYYYIQPLYVDSIAGVPGPKQYAVTKWRLARDEWDGQRTRRIHALHEKHGSMIRIGPREVHFNTLSALRTIYGGLSRFERTSFYSMFDVYGQPNLFTFHSADQHAARKKILTNSYSRAAIMKDQCADMIESKVRDYMNYLHALDERPDNIFDSLHWFSIDVITDFVYGKAFGATSATAGNQHHRALLQDILHPARRRLSWFAVHFPSLTKWMYTRTGAFEQLLNPYLPMPKPATYTGIRRHALQAWDLFKDAATRNDPAVHAEPTIIAHLWTSHTSQLKGPSGLTDLDIASECADHLLAGIDTTADTLMFLIWALSQPKNHKYQAALITELQGLPTTLSVAEKLPYLAAVIKETLRLYAPLPATEPRSLPVDTVIDNQFIPAHTTVGMSPFTLHRNPAVFPDPLTFNPERWLESSTEQVVQMNKWFWAFADGARMCIGSRLAMAEMMALVAAVYAEYRTEIAEGFEGVSPAITSRFELFYDERCEKVEEHRCMIRFIRNNY